MLKGLPPLGSVRAFEAAARHLSFTKAASELGMTQAAVSWQIRSLEQRLGGMLFDRGKRGLSLTPMGSALFPKVSKALETLEAAFEGVSSPENKLVVSSPPTFAHSWLAQNLIDFQSKHPGIGIEIEATTTIATLRNGYADVAIRKGLGNWPGLISHRLWPVVLSPICAPELIAKYDTPLTIERLGCLPLLQPISLWSKWLSRMGMDQSLISSRSGASYPRQHMAMQAVVAGQGIALLNPLFCSIELQKGTLVQPIDNGTVSLEESYWLVYPRERQKLKTIEAFQSWIREKFVQDAESPMRM